MLTGVRVLDSTDERGTFAGYLLAQLGADVIAVEPPDGSAARRTGPFDTNGRSLFWDAFGVGKQSVVVDLDTAAGVAAFEELIAGADVFIESAGAGVMDARGLGFDALARINDRLVHASITAFGEDGPKARWAATDLTIAAASGFMSLTGDEDRPPVRISADQVYLHAGLETVAAVLAALYERNHLSGRGQHIDVSAVESFMLASQFQMVATPLNGTAAARIGGGAATGPVRLRFVWPCLDGHVVVVFAFGSALGRFARNLMEWVCESGFCDEATRDKDWIGFGLDLMTGVEPIEEWERVKVAVAAFLATKTKAELLQAAMTRRLVLCPVSNIGEVLTDPQFVARGVFTTVDGVAVPGSFAKFDGARLPLPSAAPALGQPVSPPTTRTVDAAPARPAPGDGLTNDALSGLKVVDMTWVMAGAAGGRLLADYGATVVRIESAAHVDTIRTLSPYRDNNYDPDFSGPYNCANAGKYGLALNLSIPRAREVLGDLIRWADVVLDSYAPGVMAKLGFDLEHIREINPSVVAVSSSLLGQDGPLATLAGYGSMAAALAGFTDITGWPDRDPAGPFSAYTDSTAPRFLAMAALSGLERRRQTGQGVHVDLSQTESAIHLLAPQLLEVQLTGQMLGRLGNDHPTLSPHGVYQTAGDGWLALACRDDDDWTALAKLLGRADLAAMPVADRRSRRDQITSIINAWAVGRSAEDAAAALQEVGVPAHAVQGAAEVCHDPQLVHRQYFRQVSHETQPGGTTWIEAHRPHLSRTSPRFERGGPTTGQHMEYVLHDLLGYSDEVIAELAVLGALE